ncbi:MAG: hypothetical protein M3Z13_01565, partial [Candidatus Dormibacteraeota bacterium]|nr:hypothetical protein [Candidatus Dormibacteraeota bacterium]
MIPRGGASRHDDLEVLRRERQRLLRRRYRLRGRLARLTEQLELEEPAPAAEIVAAAKALRTDFPADYVQFIAASNGARGPVGGAHLELWPVHHLRRNNEARGSEPFLVVFGAGSGGEEFAFRRGEFLRLPAAGKLAEPEARGRTFADFLGSLAGEGIGQRS